MRCGNHVRQWMRVVAVAMLARALGGGSEAVASEPAEREASVSAQWNTGSPLSCADIRPEALGPSRSFITQALSASQGAACGPGSTGDGSGTLALRNDAEFGVVSWTFVSIKAVPLDVRFFAGDGGAELLPLRQGFHLLINHLPLAAGLDAISSEGEFQDSITFLPAPLASTDAAVDPFGGSVSAWWSGAADGQGWNLWVQSVDDKGRPVTMPRLVQTLHTSATPIVLIGVDQKGRRLVLWRTEGSSAWMGQWLRQDGSARTRPFAAAEDPDPSSFPSASLQPLVGEGMVLQLGGQWVRQFPSGEPTALPAPAWLVANPGTDLTLIRHERAYALVLPPTPIEGSGCQERVRLFSSTGESCGDLDLPFGGSGCFLRRLGIAVDGTVIQQVELNIPANDQCAWRWWPRLLR